MRKSFVLHGFGIAAAFGMAVGGARAADVTLAEVPAPVLDTVKARFVDVKIAGAAKEETPEGATVYEIGLDDAGRTIDVTLTPEGTMVSYGRQITRKDLPKPVLDALVKEYPKARYRLFEEVYAVEGKDETLTHYDVLLMTPDKQLRAIWFAPDGKVTKVEKQAADEEE